ncbi:response regulator transcription factor [Acidiphilium sp.]|uniref:response regulator transcription factor n=1 Tax=Acidiphilium sp. TaxID=527 RepID=UPI002582F293|nr:response regulator transcription factor [Acidiphilium sp.]
MRVLVVEDDVMIINDVLGVLKSSGAVVDQVDTSVEALDLINHYEYDIILLDIILPDAEGYEIIKKMRANKIDVPILVFSGLSRPQAKVKALSLGADDFITKPYDKSELMARIKAIVRRSNGFSHHIIGSGDISINTESREVKAKNKIIHLTNKEYSILELLILRKGFVLTKEIFLNHLYGGLDEPEIKIIDVFICKLRKKLASCGADNSVVTVWGKGYMMKDDIVSKNVNFLINSESDRKTLHGV